MPPTRLSPTKDLLPLLPGTELVVRHEEPARLVTPLPLVAVHPALLLVLAHPRLAVLQLVLGLERLAALVVLQADAPVLVPVTAPLGPDPVHVPEGEVVLATV